MKIFATLSLALAFAITGNTAMFYVNNSYGSDGNSGALTNAGATGPKATIQAAINAASNNDTVSVMQGSGTYNELVSIQNKNGFILSNYSAHVVKIGGNPAFDARLTIGQGSGNAQNIRVTGLTWDGTGMAHHGRIVRITEICNDIYFSNNIVQNQPSGMGILITSGGGTMPYNIYVQNNTILSNSFAYTSGDPPHSIYGGGNISNVVIEGNTIQDFRGGNSPCGIHFYDSDVFGNNIIRNNKIFNSDTTLYPFTANYNRGIGIYTDGNFVYNNIVTNCHLGIYLAFGASYNIIANNTVAYNGQSTVHGTGGMGLDSANSYSNQFINNLVVSNYGCGFNIGSGVPTHFLSNNIVSRNRGGTHNYDNSSPGTAVLSGNLIDVTAYDPAFTSGTVLTITSGSAARNTGISLATIFSTDREGTSRPQESVWDVGMDELGSGGTPTPTFYASSVNGDAAEENLKAETITVFRTDPTGQMTNFFTLTGTAVEGVDYVTVPHTNVLANGAGSFNVTITPIQNSSIDGTRTVILTISANANYTVGSPASSTLYILDNDLRRPQRRLSF